MDEENEYTYFGMNLPEYVFGSQLALRHFDEILTKSLEKTNSVEIYLLQEVYRKCFSAIGMPPQRFVGEEENKQGKQNNCNTGRLK